MGVAIAARSGQAPNQASRSVLTCPWNCSHSLSRPGYDVVALSGKHLTMTIGLRSDEVRRIAQIVGDFVRRE